jgi:hypothetical protein
VTDAGRPSDARGEPVAAGQIRPGVDQEDGTGAGTRRRERALVREVADRIVDAITKQGARPVRVADQHARPLTERNEPAGDPRADVAGGAGHQSAQRAAR